MANLERTERDGVAVLTFSGSLNTTAIAEVQEPFKEATSCRGASVIVDLGQVDFMATPAISMLLEAAQRLKDSQGQMIVGGCQPRVFEVLQRLHLDELLPVRGTVDEALREVRA